ncbi:hypothetical protein KDA_50660 [Dictyobacter alpinus]|uniref:Uncharacterized protein n=1 Tax=Dictyobacter alpinus TaxID=2014873 RepID=A0A402BE63_9CHLR|nr:hypothetical protein KDA_50660 [Dictyobacter alpinus]
MVFLSIQTFRLAGKKPVNGAHFVDYIGFAALLKTVNQEGKGR